jgi:hypothetical protein
MTKGRGSSRGEGGTGDNRVPKGARPAKGIGARLGFGGKSPQPAPGKISRHTSRGNAAHERGKNRGRKGEGS